MLSIIAVLHIDNFSIKGCHMHYCSAILKNVKALGLTGAYMDEDTGLRRFICKIFAMAFLPAELIIPLYEWIKINKIPETMIANQQFQLFLRYYETNWIYSQVRPTFLWSLFDLEDFDKRTNNNLEGLHK